MDRRPRILALFGARVIFGAERENIDVLSALREQGCEVLCLVRHEAWNDHIPALLQAHGLPSRRIPYIDGWLPGWRLWIIIRNPVVWIVGNWRLLRILREFKPTHFHAFNPLYVLSFLPALALSRTPLIYRCGDKPAPHRMVWRLLWRFIVWRTVRFVAISRFIAAELQAKWVSEDRIEVIYGRPPKRPEVLLREPDHLSIKTSQTIVFVGQVTEQKGPHLLIDAFKMITEEFPEVNLSIAGRISDWPGDDWARALRDMTALDDAIMTRVCFLGHVEDVNGLLKRCCVLVAPSLCEEALGLVVMEAKEAGIPAIVFPSGGLPEMISDGIDGIICKEKNATELAAALRYYLSDSQRAKAHGQNAQQSLARLDITKFPEKWLSVYERWQ